MHTDTIERKMLKKLRPVIGVHQKTGELVIFYSIKDANDKTGADNIGACCVGKIKSSGGYQWAYVNIDMKNKKGVAHGWSN